MKNFDLVNIRQWGIKGFLSILDQGVYSGSNFVVSVLLARWLLPEDFGAYAIAFAVFQFGYQLQNAIIIEPMSVIGPARYNEVLPDYLAIQSKIQLLFFIPFGMVVVAGAWGYLLWGGIFTVGKTIIVLGLSMTFMLYPWLTRRIFYILGKPGNSLVSSLIYSICMLLCLIIIRPPGWLSPETAIISLTLASSVSSGFLLMKLFKIQEHRFQINIANIVRQNWNYGKWITPSSALFVLASQAQLFIAGYWLGLEGAGVLRISQNIMQPIGMTIFAFGSLVLPMMSKDFGNQNLSSLKWKAYRLTFVLVVMASCYALFICGFRTQIEQLLFRGKYGSYVNIFATWGFIPILMALYSGFSNIFQAIQKPQAILVVFGISAPINIISAFIFTKYWGIWGATLSAIMGYLVNLGSFILLFVFWIKMNKDFILE